MPFNSLQRPSIQLGLLKAVGDRAGHEVTTLHAGLDLLACMKEHGLLADRAISLYENMAEHRFALGDWLFAELAFGADAPPPQLLKDELDTLAHSDRARDWDVLAALRNEVAPTFIERLLQQVDWAAYDAVGFTSTFQQNVASFALAKRVKAAFPQVAIIFGGANFDGDMGLAWMESMPFIDVAVQGEADLTFPLVLDVLACAGSGALGRIPGVITRDAGGQLQRGPEPIPVEDLDQLPFPDYGEFFAHMDELALRPDVTTLAPMLPFESARGCWWGERRHCTFCGLNGNTMRYRSKSPQRVVDEITTLALTYRNLNLAAVDNILDKSYLRTVLPPIARAKLPLHLFYETKADLSRADVELLAAARVEQIQPGIESLDSHTLALMRKGTRAAWNVNVLRWARHYEIGVAWNILWGFPGEIAENAAAQARALPALWHLQPPGGCGRLWMERFSPLFRERDTFTFQSIRPHDSYGRVYPPQVDLERAAYFFDYELEGTLPEAVYEELDGAVAQWRAVTIDVDEDELPTLTASDDGTAIRIVDHRVRAEPATEQLLVDDEATLHRACMEHPRSVDQLSRELGWTAERIERTAGGLVERSLFFQDRKLFVALALPAK